MVHSMTAFSRQTHEADYGTLTLELRSVNQRYLEPHFRLPDSLRELESAFREGLRKRLNRGKVELSLRFDAEAGADSLAVDARRLGELSRVLAEVGQHCPDAPQPSRLALLDYPGVLVREGADQERIKADALNLFNRALDEHIEGRAREGERLAELISARLDGVDTHVAEVRRLMPDILARQRENLLARLEEVRATLDPERPHRPPPGLPDAGTQPRSQHPLLQVRRRRHHPLRRRAQGADRTDARADSEYRVISRQRS